MTTDTFRLLQSQYGSFLTHDIQQGTGPIIGASTAYYTGTPEFLVAFTFRDSSIPCIDLQLIVCHFAFFCLCIACPSLVATLDFHLSYLTGPTDGAEHSCFTRVPEFTPSFQQHSFCVYCSVDHVFVILYSLIIAFSGHHHLTASDYRFNIFKLFLHSIQFASFYVL